jgi:hypothetical protein
MISTRPHGGVRPSSRDVKVAFTESPGVKQSRQRWTPSNPASVRPATPHTSGGSSPPGRPWLRRWRTPFLPANCGRSAALPWMPRVRPPFSSSGRAELTGRPVGGRRLALRRRMVLRGWWHRPPPLRCVIDRVEDRRCRGQVPGVTCLLIRVGTRQHRRRPSRNPCPLIALGPWRGHPASILPPQDHRTRRPRP